MKLMLNIGVFFLNVVYFFHKLMPVKNRISVVSRQSDEQTLDVALLFDEINKSHREIETRGVYMKIPGGLAGKIKYAFHMLGPEMHAFATSKVVILEGYTITASVLKHRKGLRILQMWHALGILKKFGYCVKDRPEGYSAGIIKALRMHGNYDRILASSEFCVPFYAKAFNYPEEKVTVIPLPRVDFLRNAGFMEKKAEEIYGEYPTLYGKKTVLYCPTFRKNGNCLSYVEELIAAADFEKYNLIVKLHPVDEKKLGIPGIGEGCRAERGGKEKCSARKNEWNGGKEKYFARKNEWNGGKYDDAGDIGGRDTEETDSHEKRGVFTCNAFTSLELLSVADYVVTDYSAFVFEAAVADKPIFLYTPDINEYVDKRGFCIDFRKELPADTHESARELWEAVKNCEFSMERVKRFSDKFVDTGGHNAKNLANLILLLYNSGIES